MAFDSEMNSGIVRLGAAAKIVAAPFFVTGKPTRPARRRLRLR